MVGGVKDARKTLQCHKGLTDFVVNLRHMVWAVNSLLTENRKKVERSNRDYKSMFGQ